MESLQVQAGQFIGSEARAARDQIEEVPVPAGQSAERAGAVQSGLQKPAEFIGGQGAAPAAVSLGAHARQPGQWMQLSAGGSPVPAPARDNIGRFRNPMERHCGPCPALAGLGVGGGLLVARGMGGVSFLHGRELPGLEACAGLGLLPLAGAAAAGWLLRREARTSVVSVLAVTAMLFVPSPEWDCLSEKVASACRPIARHRDLYRNCEVVVVTNQ